MSGHARARAGWFVAALAAAVCAAPAGSLPLKATLVALAVGWCLAPGALLARHLAGEWATDARLALALLLSPFAGGVAVTLLRSAGLGAGDAARAFAGLVALLCAWRALRAHTGPVLSSLAPGPLRFALGVALAVLVAHVLNPELTLRSDGAFHAAVVRAAERSLPPEDPFFAGLPLRYAWGFHAWAAAWLAAHPRVPATAPLVCACAAAAAAALLAVAALARRLGAGAPAALLAQGLALAGAAPFAWLVLAARAVSGEVRGADEIGRALGQGADHALRALDPGWLHPSLVTPLDKFVVVTPFAFALAGVALAAFALAAVLDGRPARGAGPLAAVVAGCVWVHPFAGLALAGATIAAALAVVPAAPAARRAAGGVAASVAVAALLLLPWALGTLRGGEGPAMAVRFAPGGAGLASAVLAGALLLPPSLFWLLAPARRDPLRLAIAAMLGAFVVPACLLRLAGDNQSKLLGLAFLLSAAPAAMVWGSAGRGRALRGAVLAASALPTLAAMLAAYARQSGGSADAPSRPPRAIATAIAQLAPRDAVLVDATLDTTRGAAPALPGATGRALLWSGPFMARKWGHAPEALELRSAVARALARGEWPDGAAGELLRSLGREPWLVVPQDSSRADDPSAHVVARDSDVLLIRLER
jgi:hypothetical protein